MEVRSENIDSREGGVAMGTIAMGFGERPPIEAREWKPRSLARRRQFDLKRYSAVARRLVATPPQMQTPIVISPSVKGVTNCIIPSLSGSDQRIAARSCFSTSARTGSAATIAQL